MIGRALARVVLLAAAFALATAGFGWWTVPVLAASWGVIARGLERSSLVAALAAMLAWGGILVWGTRHGAVGELARKLGGVMHLPPLALVLATLIFPALLAWSASAVAQGVAAR